MGHTISKNNSASLLFIDQACDNDQLLVSLSKNEAQWLSPVGWTDQQKVTLLDCRAKDGITEIDIPSEFAKDINSGDVLVLRCSELDLEKEIIWEASEIEVRNTVGPIATSNGLASGLLSRFKASKSEIVENIKTDAQVRAEEADRAAQAFKAKMDAATEAKERAQEKALKAAREAEAALKMEAERIAEMERAAKAFEEAERLKQDEHRRVEEERRAEEIRLAEEVRKAEEIRLREIAAQKEADRIEALERYEAALDITLNEEVRLKKRLTTLKQGVKTEAANIAAQSDDLESRRSFLIATEETATRQAKTFKDTALKLDGSAAQLASVQSEADKFAAKRQAVLTQLAQADLTYQDAQKKAEAAIALAEQGREQLETIRAQDAEISRLIESTSEKISATSLVHDDLTRKTEKLRAKSDGAAAELAQAKLEIEAIEKDLQRQADTEQGLRLEIEATQQAIKDSQIREIAHRGAIDHLESGGAPEDIAEVNFETRDYSLEVRESKSVSLSNGLAALSMTSGGLMNRVRSKFAREKDAKISIAVDNVDLGTATRQADPVFLSGGDQSPTLIRRHSPSLIAIGAVLGGIAILGGGVALNKSASPKLEVKASALAPTQVASAVATATEPGKLETKIDVDVPKIQRSAADASAELPITEGAFDVENFISDSANAIETKLAEIVDPTGFAFELPDMMPAAAQRKEETKLKLEIAEKTSSPKVTVKQVSDDAESPLRSAALETTSKLEASEAVNYPELTKDVQTRLTVLGFYTGDIDGLQGSATTQAIRTFKQLYSLPLDDDNITDVFLTELKRAEREKDATRFLAQVEAEDEVPSDILVAEAPTVETYDIVEAYPVTPVLTDTLPTVRQHIITDEMAPVYVPPVAQHSPQPVITPEVEPVKVASLPIISEAESVPVIKDIIKEARLIKNASARYPSAAQRRDYFVNVIIVVSYDIDESGRANNLRIASNDHSGKYNDAFEKEALKAIKKMRYTPKTVNGVATKTTGQVKRVVFRTE